MIEVSHLTKKYGSRLAVDDISFTVEDGVIYGLLGPNGAGKSTIMNILTGYLAATEGQVTVAGHPLPEEADAAKACVGYLPEQPPLYPEMTVAEYLDFAAELKGVKKADRPAQVQSAAHRTGLEDVLPRLIRSLSKGYRQRVGVAQALLHNPKIMILDEPTNGLDPAGIKDFRDLLSHLAHTQGLAVLVSSHILQEMQLMCDTVGIINNGRLLRIGSLEEITSQSSRGLYRYTLRPFDRAVELLQKNAPDFISSVEDGVVELHLEEDQIPELNRALMENGVAIYGLAPVNASLEQSFIDITGGGNVIG